MTRAPTAAVVDFGELSITNPKRNPKSVGGRESWYPYYAGFSPVFARSFFESLRLDPGSRVMDPWNGSGTTVEAAAHAGLEANGFDINPAMMVIARARMLSDASRSSITPIRAAILDRARALDPRSGEQEGDPLHVWLCPESAGGFRRLEMSIQHYLVAHGSHKLLNYGESVTNLSDIAAFYYVALFRTARALLHGFYTSNPTWVKKPTGLANRANPAFESVLTTFQQEVAAMEQVLQPAWKHSTGGHYSLSVASSEKLPMESGAIHAVLSSPPYCTRIDYAVATSLELAILGVDGNEGMKDLRRATIGSAVVPNTVPAAKLEWGETCHTFLNRVASHPSKASISYYLKNHLRYFDGVFRSLGEISRVLIRGGTCTLVVQDSHYKDVHNDLSQIFIEMARANNLNLGRRVDFENARSMARRHPHAHKYGLHLQARESVLMFARI
jgi:hypothetical protein